MISHFRNWAYLLTSILMLGGQLVCNPASARELIVGTGGFPTIQRAVDAAQPGDVIALERRAEPYKESIIFNNRSGREGEPITLDGRGATLDGSETLRPEEWQEAPTGLFRSTALPARLKMEPAILMRYFFVFNDEVNRMGHASKGVEVPYVSPQALQPGEWTYVAEERAFYLRPRAGSKLDTVRAPILAAGVSLMGTCENLQVRNLTVRHFWNDGFNIHGRSRNIRFSNIRTLGCGDDGISAHEDCQIEVDGLVSRGNATGFCHIGNSRTRSRNVLIADSASYGIFLLDASQHELENCVIRSSTGYAVRLLKGTELAMKNVLIVGGEAQQSGLAIESMSRLAARNVSVWQLPLAVNKSRVEWYEGVAGGSLNRFAIDADSQWLGDGNVWDVDAVQWRDVVLKRSPETSFQFAGQEATSKTRPLAKETVLKGELAPYGFNVATVPWYPGGEPYVE